MFIQGPRAHKWKAARAPNETIKKRPKENLIQTAVSELTREINQEVWSNQDDSECLSYKAGNDKNKFSKCKKVTSDKWIHYIVTGVIIELEDVADLPFNKRQDSDRELSRRGNCLTTKRRSDFRG